MARVAAVRSHSQIAYVLCDFNSTGVQRIVSLAFAYNEIIGQPSCVGFDGALREPEVGLNLEPRTCLSAASQDWPSIRKHRALHTHCTYPPNPQRGVPPRPSSPEMATTTAAPILASIPNNLILHLV
jgi:hypothetical protein